MDDVIVVGGRCAGASTALLLARAGLKVRVIERSHELEDVLSGPVVKRAATARLKSWGLLDAVLDTGCPPIMDGKMWLGGELVPTPPNAPTPAVPMVVLHRSVLDPILLDAARQAGVVVDMGNPVRRVLSSGTRITGVSTGHGDYPARLVIGADGRHSRIARLVDARTYIDWAPATYAYYTYWAGAEVSGMWAFLDEGRFIGMAPAAGDRTLVFMQAPHSGFATARPDPMGNWKS
jgi:2-polyprenyl-6-methoxyphenol hydroxylase-like FAD-dependent oxidoreductase